ncbi:MAG: hypothetical protein ACXABV_02705 [Candidatus Thorarchaeota archaeon]
MTLREDSDQYCMLLIGTIILSAYVFDIILAVIADTAVALHFPFLVGGPLIMVFFLVGYFRPKRGRIKVNMLSIAIVIGVLYTIYVLVPFGSDIIYATWGMGGAILLAGGFSMLDSLEVSMSPGIMEVSDLKYKPVPEPEPEPEPEEAVEAESEAEVSAEPAESEETVEAAEDAPSD